MFKIIRLLTVSMLAISLFAFPLTSASATKILPAEDKVLDFLETYIQEGSEEKLEIKEIKTLHRYPFEETLKVEENITKDEEVEKLKAKLEIENFQKSQVLLEELTSSSTTTKELSSAISQYQKEVTAMKETTEDTVKDFQKNRPKTWYVNKTYKGTAVVFEYTLLKNRDTVRETYREMVFIDAAGKNVYSEEESKTLSIYEKVEREAGKRGLVGTETDAEYFMLGLLIALIPLFIIRKQL